MSMYNFYNEEYGIRIKLTLNEEKDKLTYQCLGIKDEYKGNFGYNCKNGWTTMSLGTVGPDISRDSRTLYLRNNNHEYDDRIVTDDSNNGLYFTRQYVDFMSSAIDYTCKSIEQTYNEIIEMLEEIGNDEDQARLFLDM